MTIKDCFEVAGMVTSAGAPALQNYNPKEVARAVARLRRAGAILLGKTNVPNFTSDFQTYNSIFGTTNNPSNQDFSPGVLRRIGGRRATGLSALELGPDLGGAVRPPAPTGPVRHDQKHDHHARSIEVNGEQRPYYDLMVWAYLATGAGLPAAVAPVTLGPDGLRRGFQIIAASVEDRTAIACAAMLEALGAGFRTPRMASP